MSDSSRQAGHATIEYARDPGHRHEGYHRIAVAGSEVVVQGDGATNSRNRLSAAKRALSAAADRGASGLETVEQLVGALVLEGATNITVDGRPIVPSPSDRTLASLTLDVVSHGQTIEIIVGSIGAPE